MGENCDILEPLSQEDIKVWISKSTHKKVGRIK